MNHMHKKYEGNYTKNMMKLLKISDKDLYIIQRKRADITYSGTKVRMTAEFSLSRKQWNKYLKN